MKNILLTVGEYIHLKYEGKIKSVCVEECVAFGIEYPLKNGWYFMHKDDIITETVAKKLHKELFLKKKKFDVNRVNQLKPLYVYTARSIEILEELFSS